VADTLTRFSPTTPTIDRPRRDAEFGVQHSVHEGFAMLTADALDGRLSPRAAARVERTLDPLARAAAAAARIVHSAAQMSAEAAVFTRTIEACATDIAELRRERKEADLVREHLRPVVAAEMQARLYTARAHAAEYELRALRFERELDAARHAEATTATTAPRGPQPSAAQTARDQQAAVLAEQRGRVAEEAALIVTRVRNGGPLFDHAHPFDGYAACVYLQGKPEPVNNFETASVD
jgi:hypothetical protein